MRLPIWLPFLRTTVPVIGWIEEELRLACKCDFPTWRQTRRPVTGVSPLLGVAFRLTCPTGPASLVSARRSPPPQGFSSRTVNRSRPRGSLFSVAVSDRIASILARIQVSANTNCGGQTRSCVAELVACMPSLHRASSNVQPAGVCGDAYD